MGIYINGLRMKEGLGGGGWNYFNLILWNYYLKYKLIIIFILLLPVDKGSKGLFPVFSFSYYLSFLSFFLSFDYSCYFIIKASFLLILFYI